MDLGVEDKDNQVYQVTPLSVPWFPQGTVPDGPGHLFVMFLVAFVQVLPHNAFLFSFAPRSILKNCPFFISISGCPCNLLVLSWD